MSLNSSVDPQGFIVYDPAATTDSEKQVTIPEPSKKKSSSWFSKFFILEDGVISLSLRDMTVILSLGMSATLLVMGYLSCTDGTFVCNTKTFPMISDVIIAKEMYNRTFLLMTTIIMFGVQQVNIRAFYKKLYGIIPDGNNNFLFDLGLISCFALPMIGIFDEKNYITMHCISAGFFFGCFGIYCVLLGRYLWNNRDKFAASEQRSISIMVWNTWGLIAVLVLFGVSTQLPHTTALCPLSEWALVLYYANFFAIASYTNEFYDSIHEVGTFIPKAHPTKTI